MGWARKLGADKIDAHSAGTRPVKAINPYAVEVMAEKGIDLKGQRPKPVEEVPRPIDLIVAVCGQAAEECVVPPGGIPVERWDLPDPARAHGTDAELRETFRETRDVIERKVEELLERV